jgi:hypothetical protein
MTTMKRKDYERPAMKVIEVRKRCHILAGSGPQNNSATMNVTYTEEDI